MSADVVTLPRAPNVTSLKEAVAYALAEYVSEKHIALLIALKFVIGPPAPPPTIRFNGKTMNVREVLDLALICEDPAPELVAVWNVLASEGYDLLPRSATYADVARSLTVLIDDMAA